MRLSKHMAFACACAAALAAANAAAQPAASTAASTAAATQQAAQPAGQLTSPYRINSGDDLEIYVWGEERLQRTVRVLPDGTIAFPLAGQLMAQGKLPQELEAAITERLRDQYRGQVPQVTVSVKAPAGMQVSVMGRVKSPGTYTPGRYITLLEALSLAGGPAEFANLDSVLVIRKQGDRLSTIRYKLSSLFRSGAGDSDVARANVQRIEPGDTIIVP